MTLAAKVVAIVGYNEPPKYAKEMMDLAARFHRGDPSIDLFDDRITETVTIHNVTIRREWSLQYLIGVMAMQEGGEFEHIAK